MWKKGTTTKIRLGTWSLNVEVEEISGSPFRHGEKIPSWRGEKLSLLKKHPWGKRAEIPRSGSDSSHEPQPALEMSVPGREKASGGGGREKGQEQQDKKPVKVAQLLEEPDQQSCLQWINPNLDQMKYHVRQGSEQPPSSTSAFRSTRSTHQWAWSRFNPRSLPCPQPLTNDRQGLPLPPKQTPSLRRPQASPPAPFPSRGVGAWMCVPNPPVFWAPPAFSVRLWEALAQNHHLATA